MVVNDWSTAYYTNFSGSSGQGLQPFVVSYNTSPAAEVYFAVNVPGEPPTAAITAPQTCFRQIEFAGILKGTRQQELAGKFIDHMLSIAFQEDMPLQMFVFPVNPDASLPDVFTTVITLPEQPVMLITGIHFQESRSLDSGLERGDAAVRSRHSHTPTWRTITLWVVPVLFLLAFYFTPLIEIIQRSNLFQQGLNLSSSEWTVILKPLGFTIAQALVSMALTLCIGLPGAYVLSHYQFSRAESSKGFVDRAIHPAHSGRICLL